MVWISKRMFSTCFSGHEVTEITLSLNGAATYPRACAALSSMLGKNSLNPGDITVVRLTYVNGHCHCPVNQGVTCRKLLLFPQSEECKFNVLTSSCSPLHQLAGILDS